MSGHGPTLPTATRARTRRAVGEQARPFRALALVAVLALVGGTVAGLLIPPLLGAIVDVAVDGGSTTGRVDRLALALAGATLAQAALGALGLTLVASLGERLLAGLREQVVDRALGVPLDVIEQHGTGDLVARVNGDVDAVSEAAREAIPELVAAGLTVALTVVGLAALDWRLALAGGLAVPIQVLGARWYLTRSGPVYAEERIAQGRRAQQLHASIAGAATVRSLRLGDEHAALVERRSTAALGLALRTGRLRALFFSRINAAELTGLGAILAMGYVLVRGDALSVGEATAAALYFHRLFDPVGTLLLLLDTAQEAAAALARLVGVADLPPLPQDGNPRALGAPAVAARGVHADYAGGREVLHGVDLMVPAGRRVALVGASGAGKTTLGKVVAGIHPAAAGAVTLGGVPLAALGPAQLRRTVALVSQDVHVFAGTLRDDLALAAPHADDAALLSALDRVGARAWAEALPDGLDTVVGHGGERLTATQAQQLALARLVLADPPVVVLDEATAEAGSAGARILERAADAALEGRTALVIAHRLTQAAGADHVVVLQDGRVLETGTHAALADAGGVYGQLWAAWSGAR